MTEKEIEAKLYAYFRKYHSIHGAIALLFNDMKNEMIKNGIVENIQLEQNKIENKKENSND